MRTVEYAALSDAELRRRDVDLNGLDRKATNELRRRQLANLRGTGRSPAQRLAELERIGRYGPQTPQERLLRTYAMGRHTRGDPYQALLVLHAKRIAGNY